MDIAFDFRSDTPQGKDPDALSPTLRRYHKHAGFIRRSRIGSISRLSAFED
jgi:hypothetical protein